MDPETTYHVEENHIGKLFVDQRSSGTWNLRSTKQDWDIGLNRFLPLSLKVELGVGKSNLNISELNLKHLDVNSGVGETCIDLTGEWKEAFTVNLDCGVGKTNLRLPKEVGVRIDMNKGIGKVNADDFMKVGNYYMNKQYENASVKIEITIDIGIGELIVEQ
jgi:predicted membrane protein